MYRSIADAIESDIQAGRLEPGDALPTQRELAERLGVNFTTVTRAYAEARRRGIITATVGRGTFVAGPRPLVDGSANRPTSVHYDLSVNAPTMPAWLPGAFRTSVAHVTADAERLYRLLGYQSRLGNPAAREAGVAREAGARWLEGRGLAAAAERVVVTAGAQHALSVLLATIARPGDTIFTEGLTYPGLQRAAALAGVRIAGVEIDAEGVRPDALDAACRRAAAKALFCVPTFQNPTTSVMSLQRRHDIVEVARRHQLRVIEDDVCGALFPEARPLAALAPDLVVHVGSLSKCVAPGLRTAFVLMPTAEDATRLGAAVGASVLTPSPIPLAVASAWIADGTAERAASDIRKEAIARGQLARTLLGDASIAVPPGSLHAWLQLPSSWSVAALVAQAQQHGIRLAPADWYLIPTEPNIASATPSAVRLSLGYEPERARLERALRILASILGQQVTDRATDL